MSDETTNADRVSSTLGVDAPASDALTAARRHTQSEAEKLTLQIAGCYSDEVRAGLEPIIAAARAEGAAEERAAFVEQLRREKRDMPPRATDAHGMLACLIAIYSTPSSYPVRARSSGTEERT